MTERTIIIKESCELPIDEGTIKVDTSNGTITILMKQVRPHTVGESLIITKINNDNNIVYLFSDTCLINGAEIIMFGLPPHSKIKKGKVRSIVLRSDGKNWKIIQELK